VATTVRLDDELEAKLLKEAQRSGRTVEELVQETLRRRLGAESSETSAGGYRITPRRMGKLRAGLSYDHVGELLEIAADEQK